jgi:HTH-type transcriptional regulator, sugar sensing transcriptional regulator
MIIKSELIRKIREHFNLNIYETKIWLALLSKGIVSASESSEISGVPRSRAYDVLESLAKRGFAIVKIGKPVKYIAVEPKNVLEKMKTNTLLQAKEKVNSLQNLKNTSEYNELLELYNTNIDPIKMENLSGYIKGRTSVLAKLKEMISDADKEIVVATTLEDFEDKSRVLMPFLIKIKDNVKLKISLKGDSFRIKRIASKNGLRINETKNNGRFYIVDKKDVLFMINQDSNGDESGIWVNSPYFAGSFSDIFEKNLKN